MVDKYNNKMNDLNKNDYLTTDSGNPVTNDSDSLTVGRDGPILFEDIHLLEKIGQFDRERIPERVVHAKGAGAHGYYVTTNCMRKYTKARLFHYTEDKVPVFVRFSTVVGFKGSADTRRDPRGFAVKFYTENGNYDIVGNHIPIFFVRDALKFPDMIHAFKPSPNNNTTDKNRFWDFVSNSPEATNMMTFLFSDLGTIKSFRTIEGFGVNTFVWVNEEGNRHLIKYHWKPLLGVKTIDRHEADYLAGVDPDVAVRDLYDTIAMGQTVEYDLYVQIMNIESKDNYRFDPEDPTKTWPEDIFPLIKVGRLVLNRNPSNFFQETEQSAFAPSNLIPGVELSNDKLLQGRAFSYNDTHFHRLGPNFKQLPINSPRNPVVNLEQDGDMRYWSNEGSVNYRPNTLNDNKPQPTPIIGIEKPVFVKGIEAPQSIKKTEDFYQAGERYRNMTPQEKDHLIDNLVADLWSVDEKIQRKAVDNFFKADVEFGRRLMKGLDLI